MSALLQKPSVVLKRSVRIAGHRTSVSLETAFWDELKNMAAEREFGVNQLIAEVDVKRQGNLSSALRVYVLNAIKTAKT